MSGERRHYLNTRMDLYRATSAVTRALSFFSLTGRDIYTVTFYDKQEILRIITKFTLLSFLLGLFSTLNGYWNKTVNTERPFHYYLKYSWISQVYSNLVGPYLGGICQK